MSSSVILLFIICALLLLVGVLMLFAAMGVVAFWARSGRAAPPPAQPSKVLPASPAPKVTPRPAPKAAPPPKPAHLAAMDDYMEIPEEGKTEVFSRGNLNLDWDDNDDEGEATEIFRPDLHGASVDEF